MLKSRQQALASRRSTYALFALLATSLLFLAGGCGTMATGSGPTQNVRFNSYPSGANVSVDGNNVGTTPTSADLSRTSDHTVRFDLAGYPSHVVIVKHGPNPEVARNFLFPGPPGFLVDAASGAGQGALNPSVVTVTMDPAVEAGYAQTQP
jgi:hypothetical protein